MVFEACLAALDAHPQVIALQGERLSRSFPIPVSGKGGEHWFAVFYFAKTGFPPAPPKIWPPQYRLVFSCNALQIQGVEKLASATAALGTHDFAPGMDMSSYVQMRSRLFALYDRLGNQLWQGRQDAHAAEWREAGKIWDQISEKPLQNWYQSLNPSFFAALHAP